MPRFTRTIKVSPRDLYNLAYGRMSNFVYRDMELMITIETDGILPQDEYENSSEFRRYKERKSENKL